MADAWGVTLRARFRVIFNPLPTHSSSLLLYSSALKPASYVGEAQLPPVWREGGIKGQQAGHSSLRAEPGREGHGRAGDRSDVSRRGEASPKTGAG